MDSQLASVLTSGSLDVQNGSRCSGGSLLCAPEPPGANPSPGGPAGNPHPSIRQDAVSINGKKPAVGGTYGPASQGTSKSAGTVQPIRAKAGGTARPSQPIRIKIVVPSHSKTPIRSSGMLLTKDFPSSQAFGRPLLLKTLRTTEDLLKKEEEEEEEATHPKTEGIPDQRPASTCEDVSDAQIIRPDSSSDTLILSAGAAQVLSRHRIKQEGNIPLCLQGILLTSSEQTEPLDLSLPKSRGSRGRRCGGLLEDSGPESSLIMEVDEYDGEGDRDVVVEEDNEHSLLSLLSYDPEDQLFIDDQGIPYTLDPEGVKVPQVDIPPSPHLAGPQEAGLTESEGSAQSLENALKAPRDSPSPAAPPEGQTIIPQTSQTNIPEPEAVLSKPGRILLQNQPLQILTSPSTNASILLVSSPPSLSLPLSIPTSGASTAMFLLLSSVPSSTGESTSTPIAVLDPSTGQLSQITATSAPLSLPLPPGRVSPGCLPAAPPLHPNNHASLGTQAISGGDVSCEKPSTARSESPQATSADIPTSASNSEPETSDPRFESERLPLNDHIYFSNAAASPSRPNLSPGDADPLDGDPLDHLESHSPSGSPNSLAARRVLYCQLCPRVFFYLSDLERHAITHSQKKPHVCQQCGKAFKRSSHLQRHKHIHTGQRNFVCTICTKRFREAGELQRHQRVHTGEKPYQCQLCHTRFAERNTLRRHTKRKHPYHQAAVNMLHERGGEGGAAGAQEEEETAEWYSSSVSHFDDLDMDG